NYLVLVDSHSKWMDVKPLQPQPTSKAVINVLREQFATFGLARYLITDNGPQFVSNEFRNFCKINGICHKPVSSYHPSSNGKAEAAVKIFKQAYHASNES